VDLTGDAHPLYASLQQYENRDNPDLIFLDMRGERVVTTTSPEFTLSVDPTKVTDIRLLSISGRTYILGGDDSGPKYLSRVGTDHVETLVCKVQPHQPVASLVQSKDDHLCRASLAGNLDYPKFELPYSTTARNFHGKLPEVFPQPGAAEVDIDNDGRPDYIVRITKKVKPLLAHGCSWVELGVLNEKRDDLDVRRTSTLPRGGCDSTRLPFQFEGQTYILSKNIQGPPDTFLRYDEISRIKDGKSETFCRIDRAPVFEVEAVSRSHSSQQASNR
jgi:hypothetical protein